MIPRTPFDLVTAMTSEPFTQHVSVTDQPESAREVGQRLFEYATGRSLHNIGFEPPLTVTYGRDWIFRAW